MGRLKEKVVAGVVVPGDLDGNGFEMGRFYDVDESFNLDHIKATRTIIQMYLDPQSSLRVKGNCTSYGLKHHIESHRDYKPTDREEGSTRGYLSNGELIVAMIAERYRFRRIPGSPNCYFNIDLRMLNLIKS